MEAQNDEADEKFHTRPNVSIYENEDTNGYEVVITGEHGLDASVKIGYDYFDGEDGTPIVCMNAHKQDDASGAINGSSGNDYAYFRLNGGDEDGE